MFSAAPTIPWTSTLGLSAATAAINPENGACAAHVVFISPMPGAGLMHRPPESKVRPLPTNTSFFLGFLGT